eukprot:gene9157-15017_t
MAKKKGKKAKAGGATASAIPAAQSGVEVVAAAVAAAFPDEDQETQDLTCDMLHDELSTIQEAYSKGELNDGLSEVVTGAGIEDPTDEQLALLAKGLQHYKLGLANPTAYIETSVGSFAAEIFLDTMPLTASNFVDLAESGFYDGLHFHRVISEFMAQGGCPRSKDPKAADAGEGAPPPASTFKILGYGTADAGAEITRGSEGDCAGCIDDEHTEKISNEVGTLAMANNDSPNTGGSQFFINASHNTSLDWWDTETESKHPVFGRVKDEAGLEVIKALSKVETDVDDRPVKPAKIKAVAIR